MFDKRILHAFVYIDSQFKKTNLYITDERIAKITTDELPADVTIDATLKYVIPGLIDPHTHFDLDLGFTTSADDFRSGSLSALYGGVTTIIDFLDPTSNAIDLEKAFTKRVEQAKYSKCDYLFHATIKNPDGDLEEYVQKMMELGIHSLKLFTTYSNSGRRTYDSDIIKLLKLSEKYGFLLLAHIENDEQIDLNPKYTYRELSVSRPTFSETNEALKLAEYVRTYGGHLYMVHLSSGITLRRLHSEYSDILNQRFFVESCPQYFTLNNDLFRQKDGYLYTLAPPIRSKEEQNLLVSLFDHVYTIGTDHCPFKMEEKNHLLLKDIPLGIGGVETSYALMYHLFKEKAIDKMTKNVSKLHHLSRKGLICEGSDADLVIYRLQPGFIDYIHSKCDYTPYKGMKKDLFITDVFLRGKQVLQGGEYIISRGKLLKGDF
ncbi:MAG: amidohydrolase family protein [Firmicutes bacterium]|nr:amidohydrolase family protein [Bacillota bacterium]